jgi:hypothetical protein
VGKATTDTLTNKSIAASQLTGTIAAAALPAGSVLQVVMGTYATQVSNSTSTYADTNLTATITPRSTSSKILVTVHLTGCGKSNNTYLQAQLVRGVTSLIEFEKEGGYTNSAAANSVGGTGTTYLDSPATASATTYKAQLKSANNFASVSVHSSTSASTITLMEIQG